MTDIIIVIKKILLNENKIYNNIFFKIKQTKCEPDSMLLDKFYSRYGMTLINIYDVPVRIIIEFDQKKNYLVPKYYEASLVPSFMLFINNRYNVKNVYLICSYGMVCVPYQFGQIFQICSKSDLRYVYMNDSFGRKIDENIDFYLIPVCCTCKCRNMEEQHRIEDMRRSLPNVYSVKSKLVLTIYKTFCSYDHRDNTCDIVRDYKELFPNQEI